MIPETDSSECEREPIHVPGSIQPIGVLIALDEPALQVQQISANAGEWLEMDAAAALDRRLDQVLGTAPAESVRPWRLACIFRLSWSNRGGNRWKSSTRVGKHTRILPAFR
jgi:light-regulated signal transduction histidine kinase (bacteriophytochrome)